MKYIAEYKINKPVLSQVLLAAEGIVAGSGYYAMHGEGKYGSNLVSRHSSWNPPSWGEFNITQYGDVDNLENFSANEEWLRKVKTVGWKTCAGNVEDVTVKGDILIYRREGNRHGIPNNFVFLREVKPAKILEYRSERRDASPFECGLLPDFQKHPDLTINPLLGKLGLYAQDLTVWSEYKRLEVLKTSSEVFNDLEYRCLKHHLEA